MPILQDFYDKVDRDARDFTRHMIRHFMSEDTHLINSDNIDIYILNPSYIALQIPFHSTLSYTTFDRLQFLLYTYTLPCYMYNHHPEQSTLTLTHSHLRYRLPIYGRVDFNMRGDAFYKTPVQSTNSITDQQTPLMRQLSVDVPHNSYITNIHIPVHIQLPPSFNRYVNGRSYLGSLYVEYIKYIVNNMSTLTEPFYIYSYASGQCPIAELFFCYLLLQYMKDQHIDKQIKLVMIDQIGNMNHDIKQYYDQLSQDSPTFSYKYKQLTYIESVYQLINGTLFDPNAHSFNTIIIGFNTQIALSQDDMTTYLHRMIRDIIPMLQRKTDKTQFQVEILSEIQHLQPRELVQYITRSVDVTNRNTYIWRGYGRYYMNLYTGDEGNIYTELRSTHQLEIKSRGTFVDFDYGQT